jgi:hypothetical protein
MRPFALQRLDPYLPNVSRAQGHTVLLHWDQRCRTPLDRPHTLEVVADPPHLGAGTVHPTDRGPVALIYDWLVYPKNGR